MLCNFMSAFLHYSLILCNGKLCVVLDVKSLQECPFNFVVLQDPNLVPILFLLFINGLPDDVACNIVMYIDDKFYPKCDLNPNSFSWLFQFKTSL